MFGSSTYSLTGGPTAAYTEGPFGAICLLTPFGMVFEPLDMPLVSLLVDMRMSRTLSMASANASASSFVLKLSP